MCIARVTATPVDGFIRPSDAPGIGISIDPAAFAE